MSTATLETYIPQDIYLTLQAKGMVQQKLAAQVGQLLAIYCYQQRLLSLGTAARLANLNISDFITLLAQHQVAVIDYTDPELALEFAAVDQLAQELGL